VEKKALEFIWIYNAILNAIKTLKMHVIIIDIFFLLPLNILFATTIAV